MRAGIYARLSRLKPTEQLTAAAMERQEDDCRELVADRGWELARVYPDEGLSAAPGAKRRPEFERALEDLATGRIDVLVIWKLDRFTRSLWDLLRIERALEAGGQLVSVKDGGLDTTSAAGRFLLRQRCLVAEMELENIRDRVTRWHRQRAAAGKPLVSGRRPFGYATKDRSQVDETEAQVIREAARRLVTGKSLRSVVYWVNDELGVTAPNGKPWKPPNFRAMLLSPGIAGLRSYKGQVVATGTWSPILTRVEWTELSAVLNDPTRFRAGRPSNHLLTGLVTCGLCERPMNAHYRKDGARQYACRTRPGERSCGKMAIKAEPVEQVIVEAVLERLAGPGLRRMLATMAEASAEYQVLAEELIAAETHRDEVEHMFKVGEIKRDAFLRMHGPAEERVVKARRLLAEHNGRRALAELPEEAAAQRAWWDDPATTIEQKRAVLKAVLEKVIIGPCGPRQSKFDPARVLPPYGPQWIA